ncbi:VWA domain-containing protein [Psychroflexus gondwanensis]|jgi:Ca-activated chloride channel family protein|uniref:VWFA domain protein, BatI aerotolerance operon protein BatA n=1 Tax=Psychroflexus gondwanensis ACAM 44 TaxID=1189619 RepID=N1X381_9FLAO|nr:VWA domain-containing protein [Psychroflexus gondwanensis]EMY82503.1 vWFA domain protein, BatI aerotolerance operon protein BatA [Psychroflexus gondwanensis ACAM 44]TXE21275.1 VWA domain-containing protein [Psychroflexus gondwanensis]
MMIFENFTFENPSWFWLLLSIPLAVFWYWKKRDQQNASLKMSSTQGFKKSTLAKLRPLLFILKMLALVLLTIAMARPRTVDVTTKVKKTEGIDIIMAVDISASMLARDLEPNRLEALKKVAINFIEGRPNDRIGLVIYAGESYTKTPLTSDKSIIFNAINDLEYTQNIEGGTAIGMGLATSVNKLKDSKAKSKVIILLTDGENNAGFIDPKTATQLATEYDIKTYTIGVGSNGMALSPVGIKANGQFEYRNMEVKIDEALLKTIAESNGGKYFRATDNQKFEAIYEEIDALEKTEIEEFKFYNYDEKYRLFLILAGGLLFIEFLLKHTLFRSFV